MRIIDLSEFNEVIDWKLVKANVDMVILRMGYRGSTTGVLTWDKKYKEKVKKGYVDQSDLIQDLIQEEKKKGPSEYKDIENKVIAEIVARLQDMANKTIQKN